MDSGHLTAADDSARGASGAPVRDRAQTVQDFAVGIGIFLLAIAVVFSFVPSIITPFEDAGSADTAQADRIAATIVENASTGTPNKLNETYLETEYNESSEDLGEKLGLRSTGTTAITHVNITLVEVEYPKTEHRVGGDTYDDQIGSSATRIVTTNQSKCEPACKLVVKLW